MFLAEMKKIWRPWTVLLIVSLSVLFFFSFLYRWMKPFLWDGEDALNVEIEILLDWIDQYGNTIDEAEFADIEADYQGILAQAGSVIDENSFFRENGVDDYEAYLDYEQKAINAQEGYAYDIYAKMRGLILGNTGYCRIYFQEYEYVMQQYRKSGNVHGSILPFEVFGYTSNYLMYLAIWCLLCVFLIAAPVMVNDRENHVVDAQYSSKVGRKLYRVQYLGMMLSSFFAVSVVMVIGMLAWKRTGTYGFAKSDLSSFLNMGDFVSSMTYKAYIVCFIVMIYLLALGVGGVIFYMSANSSNTISMLLKAIPVLAAGCMIARLLRDSFDSNSLLYRFMGIRYCELIVAVVVWGIGIFLNEFLGKST